MFSDERKNSNSLIYKKCTSNFHNILRLIPLTEEIKQEIIMDKNYRFSSPVIDNDEISENSGKGVFQFQAPSEKSFFLSKEDLLEIIRQEFELHTQNLQLSKTYVKKSELVELQHLYQKYPTITGRSISEVVPNFCMSSSGNEEPFSSTCTNKSIENIPSSQVNSFLRICNQDNNNGCTAYDNDDLSVNTVSNMSQIYAQRDFTQNKLEMKSMQVVLGVAENFNEAENNSTDPFTYEQIANTSSLYFEDFNTRLSEVETKVRSLRDRIKRIQFLKGKRKKSKCFVNSGHNLKIETNTKSEDNAKEVEDKLVSIEEEKEKVQQQIDEDSKINLYDEMYYEWRECKMNLLHYKKSETSLLLNLRPNNQQFTRPFTFNLYEDHHLNSKLFKGPTFRITPSITKINIE